MEIKRLNKTFNKTNFALNKKIPLFFLNVGRDCQNTKNFIYFEVLFLFQNFCLVPNSINLGKEPGTLGKKGILGRTELKSILLNEW